MRRDTIDIIAGATPEELAAGLTFNRTIGTGPRKVLRDGRVRLTVYLEPDATPGRGVREPSEPAITRHGLDNGASRL